MFNLPFPLRCQSLAVRQLLRFCHSELSGDGRHQAALRAATSNGPSEAECVSRTPEGHTYGPSVLARSSTQPPGDWLQRIRLYREGLATSKWVPSPVTKQYIPESAGTGSGVGKEDHFNYPVTILFGLDDLAFDTRIVLDCIEDYFVPSAALSAQSIPDFLKQSRIIRLRGQGHWFFAKQDGAMEVEEALLPLLTS